MTERDSLQDDRRRGFNLNTWWKVLAHARPYRLHLIGLGVGGIAIVVCEVLLPYLTGRIVDEAVRQEGYSRLQLLGGTYFGVIAVLCAGICGFIVLAGRIATGVSHNIRRASFAKLQELPFAYYDRRPVGWLMARLTSDCDRLSRIVGWTLLDFLWGFCMVVGIAVVMLSLNVALALLVLTVVPPLLAVSIYYQRRLLKSARDVRQANSEITANFNDGIMGVRTTKALVREQEVLAEFQDASGRMFQHSVRNALESAVYVPLVIALGSTMAGLALWFGGARVLGGTITIGTLVTFMNYAGLFFQPVQEMARQLTEVQMAQAAAERIVGLLDTEPAIRDSAEVFATIHAAATEQQPPGTAIDGGEDRITHIEFENVSFAYEHGRNVLENFNLAVDPGETIALVGSTGGGKSTIVSLLCRFYEPTAGRICVNGIDYRGRSLHWLQSSLGIVLQTPHLFSGTVRDNIRYGDPTADDSRVVSAAKLAGAHDFITRMPNGYDSQVGQRGGHLSTGQKQLVSLARAILADPQVFVMDEATSSVDTEAEHLIQQGVERVLSGRISFIIAHRLSTIRSASRILVIEDGRITEAGSHVELLALRGRYSRLYARQFADEFVRFSESGR